MNHLPVLPIVLPMFMGALLLLIARSQMSVKRSLSLVRPYLQIHWRCSDSQAGLRGMRYAAGNWGAAFPASCPGGLTVFRGVDAG